MDNIAVYKKVDKFFYLLTCNLKSFSKNNIYTNIKMTTSEIGYALSIIEIKSTIFNNNY